MASYLNCAQMIEDQEMENANPGVEIIGDNPFA
jgi:hypothetical protein